DPREPAGAASAASARVDRQPAAKLAAEAAPTRPRAAAPTAHAVTPAPARACGTPTPRPRCRLSPGGRYMHHRRWIPLLLACLCARAAGGRPAPEPATRATTAPGAEGPAGAVRLLTGHLRDNALDAYARDALPPGLHARMATAWREGRTRWPLDELPLGEHLPDMLAALARPGAEAHWQQVFDRQFAHADREIDATAATLGLFGAQYVANEGDFSDSERDHYAQIIAAMSHWAQSAPLPDPALAHAAI